MATGTGPDARNCALGGRLADQATHPSRQGEHALQPKHICRQAHGRHERGERWVGGCSVDVRARVHRGLEEGAPTGAGRGGAQAGFR